MMLNVHRTIRLIRDGEVGGSGVKSRGIFFSLFIFRGHSTREPPSSGVTYFILQAYTGTMS